MESSGSSMLRVEITMEQYGEGEREFDWVFFINVDLHSFDISGKKRVTDDDLEQILHDLEELNSLSIFNYTPIARP